MPLPQALSGALERPAAAEARAAGLRAFASVVTGFTLIALTNAIAIAVALPRPSGGFGLRAAHHLLDAAQTFGVGAALGAGVGLWVAFVRAPLAAHLAAYAAFSTSVMGLVLGQDLERQSFVFFEGRLAGPLFVAYLALTGLGVVVAHLIGAFLGRFRFLCVLPVLFALAGMAVNHLVLPEDYPAVHGAISWGAATLSGAALGPRVLRVFAERAAIKFRAVAAAAIIVVAALGLFVPPPNRARMELLRDPCALGAWVLAQTLWSAPSLSQPVSAPPSPWSSDRSALAPVPPSAPRLVAGAPVVVFITIDAVRADVVADAKNDRIFPTIAGLKRSGAYFKNATSPGSQTAVSLTSVFSGRYFSQLFWQPHGQGEARFTYAAADPSLRFPELLTANGVRTMSSLSLNFLASEFGVTRGFAEEVMVAAGRKHALAKPVIDPILERLGKIKPGEAAFFYAHLTEPHAPYDRGGLKGTDRERYIAEIGVADAQVARVARVLAQRFPDRGVLIISADHGEAFGEHGTFLHTKTLYDELLRVPLLVGGAGVRGRRIEERVGLIDIGPTILDIFGVPTPPGFMGQSLVPLLRGEARALSRPLLAEGRLRRALYAGSLKVIEDSRRKIVEAYDLSVDPLELEELFSTDRARVEPALAALRAFFEAHAARAPGYSPPYKP